MHMPLGRDRQRPEEGKDAIRAATQLDMRRVARPRGKIFRKCRGGGWIVKTVQKAVKCAGFQLCIECWRILDRIGDAAEQVRGEHGATELTWQDAYTEGEGAGDAR